MVSKILTLQICDLENLDESHGVQRLEWVHSMSNIDLYKSHTQESFVSSHHFRDIHIPKCVTLKM